MESEDRGKIIDHKDGHDRNKTLGFWPQIGYNDKSKEEWGEWMREELLLDVPHRQVVFTVPKMLRLFGRC